jgi:hypothetical protein
MSNLLIGDSSALRVCYISKNSIRKVSHHEEKMMGICPCNGCTIRIYALLKAAVAITRGPYTVAI